MKHLLCFGDSNTWGYVPGSGQRFPFEVRWPGVLQARLGNDCRVIEEGLNGRTTIHEDPERGGRNGRLFLGPLLESHAPLELLILMLGSNDLMPCYASSAVDVAAGVGILLDIAAASGAGPSLAAPPVLLIAPPRIKATDTALELGYDGAVEKSTAIAEHFQTVAQARGCAFFDAARVVSPSDDDGVHLDAGAHAAFGNAIAECVRKLI